MKLNIKFQEEFNRLELVLRTLFGWIYISIPHGFVLMFLSLWSAILSFISFWAVLFTGRYPENFFEFQVDLMKWSTRVNARIYNLCDGYPEFGLKAEDAYLDLEIQYPERLSPGLLLVRFFFAFFYVIIPHGFILYFRFIASLLIGFLAFWVVLFTGKYPRSWFEFNLGTLRWSIRVNLYLNFMTDEYPPFHGREIGTEDFEHRDN